MFDITRDDIAALNDTDLRLLVGCLCEDAMRQLGCPVSGVTYGGDQRAADGGIDVRVSGATGAGDFLPRPEIIFQIKAQDMARNAILAEMAPRGVLRQEIAELGQKGGAYIIVSSRGSVSDLALTRRRDAMREAVAGTPGAASLHVDFYDRQRLASWVNQHPGLVVWTREKLGRRLSGWQPYKDWSSSPDSVESQYLLDEQVRVLDARDPERPGLSTGAAIERIRTRLSMPGGVVRIVGLSGVGKTRFVQALFDNRIGDRALSPAIVVYTDLGANPDPIPLDLTNQLIAAQKEAVLVVDNCGASLHRLLAKALKEQTVPVSLVTIEFDLQEDEPENSDVYRLDAISDDLIEQILKRKYKTLDDPGIRTIASFSDGNSRVAIALGAAAERGGSLARLTDSELCSRLLEQGRGKDPALEAAARICALVFSFDVEVLEGKDAELPRLAALAGQSSLELRRNVAELQRRGLAQSRSVWRAILPHGLAQRLARQALEDLPASIIEQSLVFDAPVRLARSFSRRLGFLHDSPEAKALVKGWLEEGGWLSELCSLNAFGLTLLQNIAPVDPGAVLAALDREITRSVDEGLSIANKRELVELLRKLAYEADHFAVAARLLLALAGEADEPNNSGSASGAFVSLFTIYLSGTHAPPILRAALLRKLADVEEPHADVLFEKSVRAMLSTGSFTSGYGFEFGARKRDYGLHPRGRDAVVEWYMVVFALCRELVGSGHRHASLIKHVIAEKAPGLASRAGLVDELVVLAGALEAAGGWAQGWAGARSAARAVEKTGNADGARRLAELAEELRPADVSRKIAAYVLPERWSRLDLAEVEEDDPQRHNKVRQQIDDVCRSIGRELAQDQAALKKELSNLVIAKGERVSLLAEELGIETVDPEETWDLIVKAQMASAEHAGHAMLAGFVCGVAGSKPECVGAMLDCLLETPELQRYYCHAACEAPPSEKNLQRLFCAMELEAVTTYSLRLEGYRSRDKSWNTDQLEKIIERIVDRDEGGLATALAIYYNRYVQMARADDPAPDERVKMIGTGLLDRVRFTGDEDLCEFELKEIVEFCLRPPGDASLVRSILKRLDAALIDQRVNGWDYTSVLEYFAVTFPHALLDALVEGSANEDRRREIWSSVRDSRPCPTDKIDVKIIREWIGEDIQARACDLAHTARLWRATDENGPYEWTAVGRYIIEIAAENEAILEVIADRMHPWSWSGSLSMAMEARLPLLEALVTLENRIVSNWAAAKLIELKGAIAKQRASEEAASRVRDERFEW